MILKDPERCLLIVDAFGISPLIWEAPEMSSLIVEASERIGEALDRSALIGEVPEMSSLIVEAS